MSYHCLNYAITLTQAVLTLYLTDLTLAAILRYRGTFHEHFDLHYFPLDRQVLALRITCLRPIKEVVFAPFPDGYKNTMESTIIEGWRVPEDPQHVIIHPIDPAVSLAYSVRDMQHGGEQADCLLNDVATALVGQCELHLSARRPVLPSGERGGVLLVEHRHRRVRHRGYLIYLPAHDADGYDGPIERHDSDGRIRRLYYS